jgi:hypothetical protein
MMGSIRVRHDETFILAHAQRLHSHIECIVKLVHIMKRGVTKSFKVQ